jgi:hypothetical protein
MLPKSYEYKPGEDYTHIYSYNKVMSKSDRKAISHILNRTNFRLLAWYFNPVETRQTGLRHIRLLHQEPMQSTGKEKFTVYVYCKTRKYVPEEVPEWDSNEETL